MKRFNTILVPTDLSEHSRRALLYGCRLAAEENAALIVLHVASDLDAWEYYADDLPLPRCNGTPWPIDRALSEKNLDLNRFLESSMADLKKAPRATKHVVLGSVPQQITRVAQENNADLIVMSPRRRHGLRHLLFGSVTDTVTRTSPCPVLSLAPLQPSPPWRGELAPLFFPWARRTTLNI